MARLLRDIDGIFTKDIRGDIVIHEDVDAVKELVRNICFVNYNEVIMDPPKGSILTQMLHADVDTDNAFALRAILLDTLVDGLQGYNISNLDVIVKPDVFNEMFLVDVVFFYNTREVTVSLGA